MGKDGMCIASVSDSQRCKWKVTPSVNCFTLCPIQGSLYQFFTHQGVIILLFESLVVVVAPPVLHKSNVGLNPAK